MRLTAPRIKNPPTRLHTVFKLASLALLLAAASPAQAQREDPGLRLNCASDFFRLCAGIDPNSADADRCMNQNRPRLSPECRAAVGDYEGRSGQQPAARGRRARPE